MFQLNDQISLHVRGQKVVGRIIGIDQYKIENFSGTKDGWPSYTVASANKGIFDRYWFVLWGKSEWILWTKTRRKKIPKNFKLVTQKSGLAHIKFLGDAGASTPIAALAQYKKSKSYFCIERFSNSEVMLFAGQTIKKPKTI